ncbi:uncharacterized protein LOC103577825 isoform X1 [Microplitis demolitor]|uniref:uncharacterized protein LOC103577825 isoform X1 n=1 Tax=Microplitis demolitor TaxID=69319 RepID=UPI0004CD2596|nr:uncharacterized protein LOC103577825 isoform X1 [Microplitis demolitor]
MADKSESQTEVDEIFVEYNKNWCCVFEDLIECPICYEVPSGNIHQCTQGHDLCHLCVKKVGVCPICSATFNGTRNRSLEKLIPMINDFKSFSMDPTKSGEQCRRIKKISRSTQTLEGNVNPLRRSQRMKTKNLQAIN